MKMKGRTLSLETTSVIRTVAATVALAAIASPALAAGSPQTRLVSCGEASCLVVTGHRASARAAVLINGHEVSPQGARNWKVSLPVETVRAWSEPLARSIEVTTYEASSGATTNSARLPIGLLGTTTKLDRIVISLK